MSALESCSSWRSFPGGAAKPSALAVEKARKISPEESWPMPPVRAMPSGTRLAMEPEIMLLDEPTSSLDPELTGEVLAVIRKLAAGGMTMLTATHQIEFAASLADEIIFMENGTVVEQGPARKVLFDADGDRTREFCARIRGLEKGISS